MTVYVSMGSGNVSLSRTLEGTSAGELHQQLDRLLAQLLAMVAAVERVEVTHGV